jgi:uncharacterized protein (DUF2336 family)
MRPEARSLIAELDSVLSSASDSRHLTILRRVTDLFLDGSETFSDDQVAIFDDVICRLIEQAECPVLIELSARLASVSNQPVNVVSRLSYNDDISVSSPFLEKSENLTDEMLIEIAGTKSQKHLAAIAGRMRISDAVADILVYRGNSEVACQVTANPGARFSELGFVTLIRRAKNDKVLAAAVASRTDMPPELQPFLKLALA